MPARIPSVVGIPSKAIGLPRIIFALVVSPALGHWREKESVPPHPAPAAWVRAPGTRGHGWAAAAGSAGT